MKIALFLPNWIGDAVMATPALRAVRLEYPTAEIVAVVRPYLADVLVGLDLIDRVLLHDPRGNDRELRGWQFVRRLRSERFDIALLLPNSLRSGWNAWLSGAKKRVGFARNGRGWMLTDTLVPRSKKTPHPALDEYLRLAEHLGCQQLSQQMELATQPEDEQRLEEFWSGHDSQLQQAGFICLNPGGAFGAAKHWPTASFGELAARIAGELNKTVLVLCGPAERDEAREIVRQAKHPHVLSMADVEPGIGLTKAAVKHCELLVTTDSGPRHFAPPFNVPVVTLFGSTHIEWSETHYSRALHLQHQVDCGPCQQRVCPLQHHRCMRELSAERVYGAVVNLLNETADTVSAA
ncbi:MAG: lipopolysaccharide heptosyltransferase II [Planctomycetaceae bacterium]|jgi:heptosyltransferase II|nr:lipopolysaccharide heptosyltransferase II [Planctomycetaceae bacterium]MBT6156606.1 lipopolysaccharide heptosyltransferase II [Planctomycetaceae bacterium]MBT6486099.1 lipopolysaccharide heptosyltransferase II [Planctomycetaceae bacterium]MBT6496930.1 lipopolysaccharide heptosyltransferase II [Planctomycetaceae bacterium]